MSAKNLFLPESTGGFPIEIETKISKVVNIANSYFYNINASLATFLINFLVCISISIGNQPSDSQNTLPSV